MPVIPALVIFLQGTSQTQQAAGPGSGIVAGSALYVVLIVISLAWSLATIWCILDAFTNNDNGCLWLMLMLSPLNPIVVPFYFFGKLYSQRSVSRRQLSLTGKDVETDISMRFASEIERAKFIQSAMKGGGTMYEPGISVQERPEGRQHFRDERAEGLLQELRYDDAWSYLIDLYSLAREDADFERVETYRSYLARIPQGLERLTQWEQGSRSAAAPVSANTPGTLSSVPPAPAADGLSPTALGRASRRRPDRGVPF